MMPFESEDSVSVIMRNTILEINKGEVEKEVIFDDDLFKDKDLEPTY